MLNNSFIRNFIFHITILVLLFLSFSRGIYEIFFPKSIAYFFTLLFFVIFFFVLLDKLKPSIEFLLLVILFLLSSIYSFFISDISNPLFFLYVIFFAFSILFFKISSFKLINNDCLLNFLIIIFLFFHFLQQFHLISSVGNSWNHFNHSVRPSSITGSFLHYPIILSFLTIYKFINNNYKFNIFLLVLFFSILSTWSRMGFLLIIVFFSIHFFLIYKFKLLKNKYFLISTAVFFLLLFLVPALNNRFISGFNFDSVGNSGRIVAWLRSLERIYYSNDLFGNYFGIYTNLSLNFSDIVSNFSVTESSILSLLLNFGLIGMTLFYILIYIYLSDVRYGKVIFITLFIGSLFYPFLDTSSILITILLSKILISNNVLNEDIVKIK